MLSGFLTIPQDPNWENTKGADTLNIPEPGAGRARQDLGLRTVQPRGNRLDSEAVNMYSQAETAYSFTISGSFRYSIG